ncbi:BRO-N domain-containing protein [Azotobacter salinestris]|uniref:BRO-N domain-containing protein n=1 Tax=Azotobacter salinestris TaxID=69964 RepID=UPI0032DF7EF8
MSSIVPFNFEAAEIRVVTIDGEPWFVAFDVASALGYAKPENAIARHCKAQTTTPKQGGGFHTVIPERDVYRLVMKSKLPAAERFEEWVVGEVLPSIRKTGGYNVKPVEQLPQDYITALEHLLEAKKAEREAIAERDHAIATKAHIGSKREAAAMAKASSAVREVNRLKEELGRNQKHATIISVERAVGEKLPKNTYVALRRWCKANGVEPVEVVDERYGSVKAWPAAAWMEAHCIDLRTLFSDKEAAA